MEAKFGNSNSLFAMVFKIKTHKWEHYSVVLFKIKMHLLCFWCTRYHPLFYCITPPCKCSIQSCPIWSHKTWPAQRWSKYYSYFLSKEIDFHNDKELAHSFSSSSIRKTSFSLEHTLCAEWILKMNNGCLFRNSVALKQIVQAAGSLIASL